MSDNPRLDLRLYIERLRRRGGPYVAAQWEKILTLHEAAVEQPQYMGMTRLESLDALEDEFKPVDPEPVVEALLAEPEPNPEPAPPPRPLEELTVGEVREIRKHLKTKDKSKRWLATHYKTSRQTIDRLEEEMRPTA